MKKTFILIALLLAFSPITQAAETADTTTTAEPVSFIGSWGAPDDSAGDAVEASARHPFKGDRFSLEKAKEYDTDGDGALSDTEKEAMKAAIKAEMETKKAEMLAKYDTDGDGSLSDTEKTAMHEAIKAERDARKAELLTKYDADGDGSLSDTEKATMKEAMKAEMEAKLLEKFDADGDGTLSDSEKSTMESSRPQKGKGRGPGGKGGPKGPPPGMKNRR